MHRYQFPYMNVIVLYYKYERKKFKKQHTPVYEHIPFYTLPHNTSWIIIDRICKRCLDSHNIQNWRSHRAIVNPQPHSTCSLFTSIQLGVLILSSNPQSLVLLFVPRSCSFLTPEYHIPLIRGSAYEEQQLGGSRLLQHLAKYLIIKKCSQLQKGKYRPLISMKREKTLTHTMFQKNRIAVHRTFTCESFRIYKAFCFASV